MLLLFKYKMFLPSAAYTCHDIALVGIHLSFLPLKLHEGGKQGCK